MAPRGSQGASQRHEPGLHARPPPHLSSATSSRPPGSLTRLGLATYCPLLSIRTALAQAAHGQPTVSISAAAAGAHACVHHTAARMPLAGSGRARRSSTAPPLQQAHVQAAARQRQPSRPPMAAAGCSEMRSAGENWLLCLFRSNLMSSATSDRLASCLTRTSMLPCSSSSCTREGAGQAGRGGGVHASGSARVCVCAPATGPQMAQQSCLLRGGREFRPQAAPPQPSGQAAARACVLTSSK